MRWKFLPVCLFMAVTTFFQQGLAQNVCIQDTFFHIVVLGSSTAAGSGASPSDSSWVNRYRAYLQSLNPGYQVTNRAVGGYNTYRIMPTGYVQPSGRPDPDTLRNITYAIALQPDAIIVNLPSNDVSQGFTVQEQLDNWDTVWNHAQAAGIPIWICTTQPKNYSSPTNVQKQVDVRDSIWARYSPQVLDFWSGIADSTNQIDPQFDSGDGTHLNNTGHFLLFTRARDADLPSQLYIPPLYVDASPLAIRPLFAPLCGDSLAHYEGILINRGQDDSLPLPYTWTARQLPSGPLQAGSGTVNPLASCAEGTISMTINTNAGGDFEISLATGAPNDGQPGNDTLTYRFSTLGQPTVMAVGDTGCSAVSLQLQAFSQPGDSFRWYDALSGGNFLGSGATFDTPLLGATTSFFVEALRGDFFFRNALATTTNSNINWNGTMFDLVADSALVLDALALKVRTLGNQTVVVRTRAGTHLGYETNAGAWSSLGNFAVNVSNTDSFVTIGPLNRAMGVGDTLGIYLSMLDPAADLGYQNMSQPLVRSNDELEIRTGSGSSFNFGGNFFPRDWNGEVFYHFGTKPEGDCQSERVEVEALVSNPQITLGADTILNITGTLTLDAGPGFTHYQWSTGESSASIVLDGNQLGTGVYSVVVQATDAMGCSASDTIIVVFAPLVGLAGGQLEELVVWPNPSAGAVGVFLPLGEWELRLWDANGKEVGQWLLDGGAEHRLALENLPAGLYWMVAEGDGRMSRTLEIQP